MAFLLSSNQIAEFQLDVQNLFSSLKAENKAPTHNYLLQYWIFVLTVLYLSLLSRLLFLQKRCRSS